MTFVVIAIFKNETKNLKEWINHYIWQGAEHLYLCDNESTDNPLEILQPYIDKGIITYWIDTRHMIKTSNPVRHIQIEIYREVVYNIQNLTIPPEWIVVCDLDEFWYGKKTTISNVLRDYLPTVHVVYLDWLVFGPSESGFHPESLRKELVYRRAYVGSPKFCFRTKNIYYNDVCVHVIDNISSENSINGSDKLQLNHYVCQSQEYWQTVKIPRGCIVGDMSIYNNTYFIENSIDCTTLDTELSDQVKKSE
jgi:glycosyltransferase involved in cell wall biosynthesis